MAKKKNPHAQYLGKKGGKARLTKLSAQQRSQLARHAAQTRWARDKEER